MHPTALLYELFEAALSAALPERVIKPALPDAPDGNVVVLGAGKASASMAAEVERAWPDAKLSGLIVTRYGHKVPTQKIEVVEASHPVPDAAGLAAAEKILALARAAGPDDLVVCLMSGGASALLSLPAEGVSFAEKQDVNAQLLRSGAPIDDMNTLRKRLSAIKGGRLAAAIAPARALTLMISDVPGDEPAVIGSGPTVPDDTTADSARRVVERYGLALPRHLLDVIEHNHSISALPEGQTLKMVATPQMSLDAAAARARELNVEPLILGDAIEGEAREVGRVMAGIAQQVHRHGQPLGRPCVLLSGGETTVTIRGEQGGRGGRNSEFLLGFGLGLQVREGIHAIACDTDGIDGSEDNAGAIWRSDSLARALALGLNAEQFLDTNDAYSFFAALDDLVEPGPTLTNVNDFRAVYVE